MRSARSRPAVTTRAHRRRRAASALGLALVAVAAVACQPDTPTTDTYSGAGLSSGIAGARVSVPPPTTTPTTAAPTTTTSAPPAAPTTVTVPATQAALNGWNIHLVDDASGHQVVRYDWNGTASFTVKLPSNSDSLSVLVKGDQCSGAPEYKITVDGLQLATEAVSNAEWTVKAYGRTLLAGTHTVDVEYANDYQPIYPATCNRNLYVDSLRFTTSPTVQAVTNASVPTGGFVHQSGTQLLDGANRPLRLRGVNLGGWLLWEGWEWGQGFDYIGQSDMMRNLTSLVGTDQANRFASDVFDNYVTGDDFNAMSRYGINVARVPFNYRMLEDDTNPGVYKQSGWTVLDDLVAEAKAHDVYLVLDMHAAPCSQSLSFISDWNGSSYLWLSQQCQDRATAMWKAIAARYANQSIIAGYDLLNETVTGAPQLLAWYQRTTAAIRSVDRNHTLIYEGNNLAREFDFIPTGMDSNMALSAHDYPWMIPGQDLSQRMPAFVATTARLNAPMWIGEFGQSSYDDYARYVNTFDATPSFAGWAQWTWKQVPGAPTMQNIKQTPASKKLVEWMTNTSRPKPTPAEAQQGMADWIEAIKFVNTVPDAKLEQVLTGS
jgi:hypothetical protein